MRLFHCTNKSRLATIQLHGLLPGMAHGARNAVWACAAGKVPWAIVHVASKWRNNGCALNTLVVLELEVARSKLTRHARGVWYCYSVIEPAAIVAVRSATEYGPSAE